MKPLVEFVDSAGRQRRYYITEGFRTYTVGYIVDGETDSRREVTEYSREVAIRSLAAIALLRISDSHNLQVHCSEVQAAMAAIREERRADDELRERERAAANLRKLEKLRLDTEALTELRKTYRLSTKPGTARAKQWVGKGHPDTFEPIAGQVAGAFILHAAPLGKRCRITHIPTGVNLGIDLPNTSAKLLAAILLKRFDWNTTEMPKETLREVLEIRDLVEKEFWNELRQRLLTAAIRC